MKKGLTILFVFFVGFLNAQDRHLPLGSNPSLFKHLDGLRSLDKVQVAEDSIVYSYDTLSLPFIDDFSSNHLPKRVTDVSGSNISDTLFYKLYIGNTIVTDINGFSIDTTFYYQFNANGDTLFKIRNNITVLRIFNFDFYPPISSTQTVYPAYNIFDTVGTAQPDTINVDPDFEQDSIIFYIVDPNPNDWYTNRDVLINNSFALNPITIGVATFDGLNQYGLPYSPDFSLRVTADELTSVPLDLSNPSADDAVYFSFYFQPKGLSINRPEAQDSLALDFYNATTKKWGNVWGSGGFSADTFQFVMIKVDTAFHKNGFQFRFRNQAQGAGAYDHWNLDYIYLDDNRDENDTTWKDVAYMYEPKPILKDYYVMPWWHYKSDPSLYGRDTTTNTIRNLFEQGLNIFYKFQMVDSASGSPYYIFPGLNEFNIWGADTILDRTFRINYTYEADSIKGPGKLESIYDISFRPGTGQEQDFIRSNDTVRSFLCLDNYYAYDDGSAETGYGINPELSSDGYVSYMAVQHQIPFDDTLGGMQIYFLPTFPDITSQKFEVFVWDNLSTGGVRYSSPEQLSPLYTDDNGFYTVWFDTNILVRQTFYIGIRSVGQYSMSVGYDLNTDNKNKINWSYNGSNWNSPSAGIFDGSLMIRPIFRKKNWGVGIEDNVSEKQLVSVYPNPAKNLLNVELLGTNEKAIFQIFSISGQLMQTGSLSNSLDVSYLNNGVYFIRIETANEELINKKFVIAK